MRTTIRTRSLVRWLAAGAGAATAAYAAYAGAAWLRYGHAARPRADEDDARLDRFMPVYDVVDRHHARIAAPADVTLGAACRADLFDRPLVRAIFKGRELILGSAPDRRAPVSGMLAQVLSLGWGVLDEVPGREVVVGAVTKPWEASPVFRPIPPAEFAAFGEPGYVKIAWTLRADPLGPNESMFRTETRALATDAASRRKFRTYWTFLSPGIVLIRRLSLAPLRAEAERRVRRTTLAHN